MSKNQYDPVLEKQNTNKTWNNIKEKLENGVMIEHLIIATIMQQLNEIDLYFIKENKRERLG